MQTGLRFLPQAPPLKPGAVPEPVALAAIGLIMGPKSGFGSPVASPADLQTVMGFAERHDIAPFLTSGHNQSTLLNEPSPNPSRKHNAS